MHIKRILWPTDYSENAAQALPYVLSFAEKFDAEVIALHVADPVTRYEVLADMLGKLDPEAMYEKVMERSKDKLKDLCENLDETACRHFKRIVAAGDVSDEILKAIDVEKVDMVIMSTHGYTGIKKFAFGSVAERVVQNSAVPVVTIRV